MLPLRLDRWEIMLKLAILAKEGTSADTLREDPSDKVTFPPEPIYEDNVEKVQLRMKEIDKLEMSNSRMRG